MNYTDAPPPIEYVPPYSLDFIAHLHDGCYSAQATPMLLQAVQRDPDGARMLDALTSAQLKLSFYST